VIRLLTRESRISIMFPTVFQRAALFKFLKLLHQAIIGEMSEPDLIFWVVVHHGKSDVALRIDPNSKGVPVCYEDPLPYIEFLLVNDQRVFDVLLDDPITSAAFTNIFQNLIKFAHHNDTAPSGSGTRLDYPKILVTPNVELSIFMFEFS